MAVDIVGILGYRVFWTVNSSRYSETLSTFYSRYPPYPGMAGTWNTLNIKGALGYVRYTHHVWEFSASSLYYSIPRWALLRFRSRELVAKSSGLSGVTNRYRPRPARSHLIASRPHGKYEPRPVRPLAPRSVRTGKCATPSKIC